MEIEVHEPRSIYEKDYHCEMCGKYVKKTKMTYKEYQVHKNIPIVQYVSQSLRKE